MLGLMREVRCAKDIDRAIEDELASHLAESAAELAASGLSEHEALAEAYRRFGDIGAYVAACRREAPHERFPSLNHCLRTIQHARSSTALQLATICARLFLGSVLITIACIMGIVAISPPMHDSVAWTSDMRRLEGMLPVELLLRILADSWPLWSFIGAIHALAGALLVTQRLATLGAGLALALFASMFVFTLSFGFMGTPMLLGGLLLLCACLVAWDLDSLQPLFRHHREAIEVEPESGWISSPFWACLGATMVLATAVAFALNVAAMLLTTFGIGVAGVAIFLFRFLLPKALGRGRRFHPRSQQA
jgi:hypothetical protein